MTSVDVFLPGHRASTLESVSVTGRRLAVFLAAVVVGLVKIVVPQLFTVAALVAFCFGAFTFGAAAGWMTVGVSMLLLEWKIRQ